MSKKQLPVAPAGRPARALPVKHYRPHWTAGTVGSRRRLLTITLFLFLML